MALSIKNEETERIVRELADRRGLSLVTAVTQAAQETLERDKAESEIRNGKKGLALRLMEIARETAEMIVDSSALIAILRDEPEAQAFSDAIEYEVSVRISAATLFEASMVADKFGSPILSVRFDEIVEDSKMVIESVTAVQARMARQAYRDYGKGSGEPILYKGDDFVHTDLRSAV